MILNTHFRGKITELSVAQSFLELGFQVSEPLVSDSRYDFIADVNGKLLKIQVKTARVSEDGSKITFATSSSHTNTKKTIHKSYTSDEIDYFATVYQGQCYIISVKECGSREQSLRLLPTKNGQTTGVKFLEDYKLVNTF